jgi:acetyl esterase
MQPPLRARIAAAPTKLYVAAMDRAVHAFARVRYSMPDAHPAKFDLALERDVAYGAAHGRHNRLDAYIPMRAPRPLPVVMYVHGGGFTMLSKDTHRVMAITIARAGYLLFNINYRQGRGHRFPEPLADACEALLWVQANCARYGGDPSRIALAGESAGGNLVTALAVAASYRRPEAYARRVFDAAPSLRAVVATYGFLDLGHTDAYLEHPRMSRFTKALLLDAAQSYLGYDVQRAARENPMASPLRVIEGGPPDRPLPPFFASVGTKDPLLRCSKRLKVALDGLGTECDLHVSPGEIHGYDAMVWRKAARAKWKAAHEFLDAHLKGHDGDAAHGGETSAAGGANGANGSRRDARAAV